MWVRKDKQIYIQTHTLFGKQFQVCVGLLWEHAWFKKHPNWSLPWVTSSSVTMLCKTVLNGFQVETYGYQPWKDLFHKIFNLMAL